MNWDARGELLQVPRGVLISEISSWEGDEWRCALFHALSRRAACVWGVLPKCSERLLGHPPRGCPCGREPGGSWVPAASLPPAPRRIASAEVIWCMLLFQVIWCALLFPAWGLGSRRMALWGGSERGSWREAEQRGRKTLAFHSSFSQFILGDQLHAIQQLGFCFPFSYIL